MSEHKGYIRTSDEKGSINIGQNVVATIAAAAAVDVDGVCGLYQSPGRELVAITGKKGISRGARVTIEDAGVMVEVFIIIDASFSVNQVAALVQKSVKSAIEEAVGADVAEVNVHVCGVSLKKAKPQVAVTSTGSEAKTTTAAK